MCKIIDFKEKKEQILIERGTKAFFDSIPESEPLTEEEKQEIDDFLEWCENNLPK